jgi:hypothetical protein
LIVALRPCSCLATEPELAVRPLRFRLFYSLITPFIQLLNFSQSSLTSTQNFEKMLVEKFEIRAKKWTEKAQACCVVL